MVAPTRGTLLETVSHHQLRRNGKGAFLRTIKSLKNLGEPSSLMTVAIYKAFKRLLQPPRKFLPPVPVRDSDAVDKTAFPDISDNQEGKSVPQSPPSRHTHLSAELLPQEQFLSQSHENLCSIYQGIL